MKKPNIVIQHKNARSVLAGVQEPIIDFTKHPNLTFCLVEPSGVVRETQVIVVAAEEDAGSIVFQVSLDLYIKSALGLFEMAQNEGWPVDAGNFNADKRTKKDLVAQLHEILDEWAEDDG